jgi:hypothetical protein
MECLTLPDAASHVAQLQQEIKAIDVLDSLPEQLNVLMVRSIPLDQDEQEQIANVVRVQIIPMIHQQRAEKRATLVAGAKRAMEEMYEMMDRTDLLFRQYDQAPLAKHLCVAPDEDHGDQNHQEENQELAEGDQAHHHEDQGDQAGVDEGQGDQAHHDEDQGGQAGLDEGQGDPVALPTCHRCNYECSQLRQHPLIQVPGLAYCPRCYAYMAFDNGTKWKGRKYANESKPLTRLCALCWLGTDHKSSDQQLVCENDTCPNRECFECCLKFRPKLYERLQADLIGTAFCCLACSPVNV